MNRITKKTGTGLSRQSAFWSGLSRGAFMLLAIAGFMFATASANAACGIMTGMGPRSPIKLPMLAHAANDQDGFFPDSSGSIVGLWHVIYSTGNTTFNDTFDTWHSDGTEFESAFLPPEAGNVCVGVWKTIAPRTIRLHHVGWLFTPGPIPGTATGSFTLDETNIVSRDGKTYTGSFTFKTFDMNGGFTGTEVNGTIAATRITVD